jgi:hypothetical protein
MSLDFVGKKRMENMHGEGGLEIQHGIDKEEGFNVVFEYNVGKSTSR